MTRRWDSISIPAIFRFVHDDVASLAGCERARCRQTRHARPDDVDNGSLHLRLASDRRGSPGIESPANARALGDKEKPGTIAPDLTDANPPRER
jgi:hypothetical protein